MRTKQSQQFFALPLEVKMNVLHKGGMSPARGYTPWGKEKTHQLKSFVEIPDAVDARVRTLPLDSWTQSGLPQRTIVSLAKSISHAQEQLDMGSPTDSTFPTPWLPKSMIPTLRPTLESFYEELRSICHRLITAIELGLYLPAGALNARCQPDSSELRLIHYPSMPFAQLADHTTIRRIWPHTDTGIFSVLFQDRVGGLMLEDRQNPEQWLRVDSEEVTEMVVNVANTLERWTNGLLRAGVHYVAAPWTTSTSVVAEDGTADGMAPERFSVVMFYRANTGTSVGPLPEFISPERPAQFEDMNALDYLKAINRAIYY